MGGVRHFLTNQVLEHYEKIGFQGHSTIYRNSEENRKRYQYIFDGIDNYREVFQSPNAFNFDEHGINLIYKKLGIEIYSEVNFVTLAQYRQNYIARYWPREKVNRNNVYLWENGLLYQKSILKSRVITDEIMYVHWQKRAIKIEEEVENSNIWVLLPNRLIAWVDEKSLKELRKYTYNKPIELLLWTLYNNRKKGVIFLLKYIKRYIEYNWTVLTSNDVKTQLIDNTNN